MRAWLCLFTFALMALRSAQLSAQDAKPASPLKIYQPPEYFAAQHRANDYLPHAKQFLADNPLDMRSPRVALDMLMFATATQQAAEIKAAKLQLLLHYPESLPTVYFFKTSQAKDIAALLKERFTDSESTLDRDTLKRFVRAVDGGHRNFGPSFCDDDLWAQCALAAQDARVSIALQSQIKNPESNAAKTVAVVVNMQLNLQQKFVELQQLRAYPTARAFQRFILSELTDDERADTAVRTVVIENLLHDQQLAAALPLLSELCKTEREPRLLFWYGWAQATTGDTRAAQATFDQLIKEHPGDAWATTAAEIAPLLDDVKDVLNQHVVALDSAITTLASAPTEVIEATACWQNEQGESQLYFGLNLEQDAFDLVTSKGQQRQLAYSVGSAMSRFYLHGDAFIHQFEAAGLCPHFTLSFAPKTRAGFDVNFHFNAVAQGSGALKASVADILKQPLFVTATERRRYVEHAFKSGWVPMPIASENGQQQLRWVMPQVDSPRAGHFEICLDTNHRITALRADEWSLKDIHYGPRKDVKLTPPSWPEMPVESTAEMGTADFMRLFGAVMSLMGADNKGPANTAQRKATPHR